MRVISSAMLSLAMIAGLISFCFLISKTDPPVVVKESEDYVIINDSVKRVDDKEKGTSCYYSANKISCVLTGDYDENTPYP